MEKFTGYVLRSADYMSAFSKLLNAVPRKAGFLEFLVNAETTSTRFTRTLLMEESGHAICQPQRADYEGEQVLLLLDRLYFIIEENNKNRHCILSLAVSTAVWIAQRKGEIRELSLVVNGIAMFANQSSRQEDLDSLYEISLHILYATDAYLKSDVHKQDRNRPWRLLCLNHCIIATRTGNADLARKAYDQLIAFLPEETEAFFAQGMRNMRTGRLPIQCREMMQAYYQMYSVDSPSGEAVNPNHPQRSDADVLH